MDPETDRYREFSATDDYAESFAQAKEGTDFFGTVRDVARVYNYPGDLKRFLSVFTKENILAEIGRSGIFTLDYRLMMEGKPVYVQMKAAMVEEKEGPRLIVGINDIDAQVRQEEEYGRRLAQAQIQANVDALTREHADEMDRIANVDALTGVRNKHSYLAAEARLDSQIANGACTQFAIVMLDVNDLKKVNDTAGHQAGDQLLRNVCRIICDTFKRSPVFRVGGDEFVVISQGSDYARIEELLGQISAHNAEASRTGGAVVACGMARFDRDPCVAAVYARADRKMYENKALLKAGNA